MMCVCGLDLLAKQVVVQGSNVPRGGTMSRRLLQLVIPVTPERRMFRIHDPSVDPDAPGGPLPPVGALISTNREQLWVGCLQEDIDVRHVLQERDERSGIRGARPPELCWAAWGGCPPRGPPRARRTWPVRTRWPPRSR